MTSKALAFAKRVRFLTDITATPVDSTNLQEFADVFTLPTTDGTLNQVLTTNGAGILSFATASGGGSSGGISTGKSIAMAIVFGG